MRRRSGFTLIEIMVSLTLVGLIAAVAGTSVIMGAQAYLFARENNAITQKAQLALNRINREFIELSDIKADATSSCIIYESPYGKRAIAEVDNTIRYFVNPGPKCPLGSGGDILVDSIKTLIINYNGASTWTTSQDIRNLYAINFKFEYLRPGTRDSVPFETTVSPRNNNNAGGASLPTASSPPPDYAGKSCFIATAAYGDNNHPVVVILRAFRDGVLMDSDLGKAFVRYYYRVGPILAEAIDGNGPACFTVRLLLAPVASFAFFLLYHPLALPVVLLISWAAARLILGILKRPSRKRAAFLRTQGGAILVTLIAAMVVFSSLGAIMLSLFSSSSMSQVAGNNTMRAYYLAESGFRYAASRYINVDMGSEAANEVERNRRLKEDLHDKEFTLSQNDGKFHLRVYPYYYVVTTAPAPGSSELIAEVKGGSSFTNAADFKPSSFIQIKTPTTTIPAQIDHADPSVPPTVRFYCLGSGCNWDTYNIQPGSVITPAAKPDPARPTITDLDGDGLPDIAFHSYFGANVFPPQNGMITVRMDSAEVRTFAYRELDLTNKLFKGVTDPNGGIVAGLTLRAQGGDLILAAKFVRLESVGSFGPTANPVTRKIDYYVPIGITAASAAPKTTFTDSLDNLSQWYTGYDLSHIGTQAAVSYGGSGAMQFTGGVATLSQAGLPKYRESQIALNISLYSEWFRAGGYLSYDVQVKNTVDPPPNPNLYSSGISFRMDNSQNAMGFTLASTDPGVDVNGFDKDAIPDGMTGSIDPFRPVFLLWMKEYNTKAVIGQSGTVQIIAPFHYDYPQSIFYPPPTGIGTYVINNYPYDANWQTGDRVRFQCVSRNCNLPQTNTTDGQLVQGKDYYIRSVWYFTHDTGDWNIYLFDTLANATRSFNPSNPSDSWQGLVDLTNQGTGTFDMIKQDPAFTKLAHQYVTSDSGTDRYNILEAGNIPKPWTTLLVRVVEAPSVSFISGGASGSRFQGGDIVYQTDDNYPGGNVQAIAQVRVDPVYREAMSSSARDTKWINGTADGVLILDVLKDNAGNVRPYTFTARAKLFAGGPPSGVHVATADVPAGFTDDVFRARSNWLSTYVGADRPDSNPDSDPFNLYRGGISRSQIFWPPDDKTATAPVNDKYTAVRFGDYVNPSYCTAFFSADNSGQGGQGGGDIIRMQSPDGVKFYSPQSWSWISTKPEVGLHAYGLNIPSIYFDEFGLQFGPPASAARRSFIMPIQK